jgi:hypothetical protein
MPRFLHAIHPHRNPAPVPAAQILAFDARISLGSDKPAQRGHITDEVWIARFPLELSCHFRWLLSAR